MGEETGFDAVDEERVKAIEADLRRLQGKLEALYRFLGLRGNV